MKARSLTLLVLAVALLSAMAYQRLAAPAALSGLVPAAADRLRPAPIASVTRPAGDADHIPAVGLFERAAAEAPPPAAAPVLATPEGLALRPVGASDRPLYPAEARQLTHDGCCPASWWSETSSHLYVVDRPEGSLQAALYRIPLWPPGARPEAADSRLMLAEQAARYVVRPAGDHSVVEDVASGATWTLSTGGSPVRLSPDGSRLVWWRSRGGSDRFQSEVRIWGSRIDGSGVRDLGALWGAEVVAFLPDNRRVLVTGRPAVNRAVAVLATLDVETGDLNGIARGLWLGHARPSPDGAWAAYTVSLDREDPEANGVWLASTAGEAGRKLPFEGAYRWRDANRLLFVPLQPGATSHELWQYDLVSGAVTRLLDPDKLPLRIANNDWSISPDGQSMTWVDETDRNLWLVDLP